jgi:hypothetical protein
MRRIGNRTPVLEWTQVTPTTRVRGVTAALSRDTISSASVYGPVS